MGINVHKGTPQKVSQFLFLIGHAIHRGRVLAGSGTGRIADQYLHKIIKTETRKVFERLKENRQTRNSKTKKDRVKMG